MKIRNYFFRDYLDKGEKIVYVAHKHIIFLKVKTSKVFMFGILIPIVLYLFFPQVLPLATIWVAIGILSWLYYFVCWYYDCWIITNNGIVDINQGGFWGYTATRVEYHMIDGLSYTVNNFWAMILNYGTITIDKMGAQTKLQLENASNPKKIERIIMKNQEKYIAERSVRDHNALKGMLSDMIAYNVNSNRISDPRK